MGWANCGTDDQGRPIGYAVEATCDQSGCATEIDRGLAYVCGNMHGGGEHGCGRYFCEKHLHILQIGEGCFQLCEACAAKHDDEFPGPKASAARNGDKADIEVGITMCSEAGCTTRVVRDPLHRCHGCSEIFCDTHIHFGTFYGDGEPANLCTDCWAQDAEPPQF